MRTRSSQEAEVTPPSVADVLAQPTTTLTPDLTLSPGTPAATGEAALAGTDQPPLAFTYTIADAVAVPEPASWAMMLAGFGLVGAMMRRRASGRLLPA